MIPTVLSIGPLAVHSFGLMLVLSLFAAWRILYLNLEANGEDPSLAERMIFHAGVGGVIGARLAYLISFPSDLLADPIGTIFGGAGFVFYGGLFGGAFAVFVLLRRVKKPFWAFADISAPALSLGYAVGRIGCHLSGDGDYGMPTDLPWGFSYLHGVVPTEPGVLVHPTPMYETFSALLITWMLLRFTTSSARRLEVQKPRKYSVGRIFGLYLILSAVSRFLVEIVRIEPRIWSGFTEAQLLSIILMVIGGWLMSKQTCNDESVNSSDSSSGSSSGGSSSAHEAGRLEVFPFAIVVGAALTLWVGALALSNNLQNTLFNEVKNRPHSPKLVELEKQASDTPGSAPLQLELARARLREATENADSKLLMAAVQSYKAVLDIDPKNADALLELARLCAQNSIYDKALDFFPRYLALKPNDFDAESDYGLVFLQTGESKKATEIFNRVLSKNRQHFRATLGLLLVARETGDDKSAADLMPKVLALAPSDEVRTEVQKAFDADADRPTSRPQSPAAQVVNYFKKHAIIGPKIVTTRWIDSTTLELRLKDFPIEKMPIEMRNLIAARAQEKLAIPDTINVKFLDDQSDAELLAFTIGAASQKPKSPQPNAPLSGERSDDEPKLQNPHSNQ